MQRNVYETLLVALLLAGGTTSAISQGTVEFSNFSRAGQGVNAPVFEKGKGVRSIQFTF